MTWPEYSVALVMDEVDKIILRSLRNLNCEIDDDVFGLHQFTTAMFVEAAAQCLRTIDPSIDVQHRLPPSMAAQFRVGANIALAVKNIGFHEDIGYHTFMYLNENDVRKVLLFLVDRLPKEQPDYKSSPYGVVASFQKAFADRIASNIAFSWKPVFHSAEPSTNLQRFRASRMLLPTDVVTLEHGTSIDGSLYVDNQLPLLCTQPTHSTEVITSIVEKNAVMYAVGYRQEVWNDEAPGSRNEIGSARKRDRFNQRIRNIGCIHSGKWNDVGEDLTKMAKWRSGESCRTDTKRSRFIHVQNQQFNENADHVLSEMTGCSDTVHKQDQNQLNEEILQLKEACSRLSTACDQFALDTKSLLLSIHQRSEDLNGVKEVINDLEKCKRLKQSTADLLPDASDNLAQLENVVDSSCKRLVALATQWEKHNVPLIKQFKEVLVTAESQLGCTEKLMEEIVWQQSKLKELIVEAREKDVLFKQLLLDYERMVKDISRSSYTQRIMEIVANIRKQNQDIDKVLQDSKVLQKEINFLSSKLTRIFSVTDEIIFKDAKKDDSVRKAYKYLASLHENWAALINTVEETGAILKEIRDLDDQLETDNKKKISDNLQQISNDYQQMLQENRTLMSSLAL